MPGKSTHHICCFFKKTYDLTYTQNCHLAGRPAPRTLTTSDNNRCASTVNLTGSRHSISLRGGGGVPVLKEVADMCNSTRSSQWCNPKSSPTQLPASENGLPHYLPRKERGGVRWRRVEKGLERGNRVVVHCGHWADGGARQGRAGLSGCHLRWGKWGSPSRP